MKTNNRPIIKILSFILTLCLILSAATVSFATTVSIPEAPGGAYVLDEAEVLDLDTENSLNEKSEALKSASGIELYVVTVSDKGGAALKDYTYELYDQWDIGGSEDKGIILVLDIESDDYYLKPGDAIRETFTGTVLQGYLDTYLEADFAARNYGDGAVKLCDALSTLGQRAYTASTSVSESEAPGETSSEAESQAESSGGGIGGFFMGLLKFILIVFLILVIFVVVVNVHGQMVRKKRREARAAARRQRQAQRQTQSQPQRRTTSYPEKPVKASSFDEDDFEEIESGSFEDEFSSSSKAADDEDDEFIISAFDDILAKKQSEKTDDDDIDFDDINLDDIEPEDEE